MDKTLKDKIAKSMLSDSMGDLSGALDYIENEEDKLLLQGLLGSFISIVDDLKW